MYVARDVGFILDTLHLPHFWLPSCWHYSILEHPIYETSWSSTWLGLLMICGTTTYQPPPSFFPGPSPSSLLLIKRVICNVFIQTEKWWLLQSINMCSGAENEQTPLIHTAHPTHPTHAKHAPNTHPTYTHKHTHHTPCSYLIYSGNHTQT